MYCDRALHRERVRQFCRFWEFEDLERLYEEEMLLWRFAKKG